MDREPDPLDAPRPDTLGVCFRAIRVFALPVAAMAMLVCLDAFLSVSARMAGQEPGITVFTTGLALSALSAVLGYGFAVFVLSGERVAGWAAYTGTDASNLWLYAILSMLLPVLSGLALAVASLLPEALGAGVAIVAYTGSIWLIVAYGTVLPAVANGDPLDFAAARARRQRFALLLRLFLIPLLGFSMLSLVVILLGYVRLPGELILIPLTAGMTLWIVASHVALAKAYRGAYR